MPGLKTLRTLDALPLPWLNTAISELMSKSTITGRNNMLALNPQKLKLLKGNIRSIFPSMSDAEFEEVWQTCILALANAWKNLQR